MKEREVAIPLRDRAAESPAGPPHELRERVRALALPEHARPGRGMLGIVAWVLVVLLAVTNGYLLYLLWKQPAAVETPTVQTPTSSSSQASAGAIATEGKGYIVPVHQILVTPKVSGTLVQVNIEVGMRVEEGAVLAVVEDTEYRHDRDRAKALLDLAKKRLLELETGSRQQEIDQADFEHREATKQLANYKEIWERNQKLFADDLLTEEKLRQSETDYLAMEDRVRKLKAALDLVVKGPREERILQAKAEVDQYAAELAKAEWKLGNTIIKATTSGTILKKNAEKGNMVNPVSFSSSLLSLCEMANLSELEVELGIQEREISKVFVGQKCRIQTDAWPERIYRGEVSRLMPIADRSQGKISVRVKLSVPAEEEGVYLKPEMSATVTFLARESRDEKAGGEDEKR
ncbi:MAG: efflux RND transporter periplasmic adaptor subunit [Planctomycetia bacterium]|nr:efflux RND transporter periplasmic adaptor subunit [Planctomycetia bacterium]